MTLGGITSSLNSTLARLNSIESNFQALNGVVFEINSKSVPEVKNVQNSEFKTILDNKINTSENNQEKVNEILPSYDDEIEPVQVQETPEIKTQETQRITDEKPVEKPVENVEEIKKDAISLKSKIEIKPQKPNINEIIDTLSEKYNVDSDFVKAIINQESGFNAKATSRKGAMGLMQLMPATAKSLGIANAYDPAENVEGGIKYLKGLLNKYSNNEELALAAYNAGSGAVKKYGGVPPYKETQNYVKSIMAAYNKAKEAKI